MDGDVTLKVLNIIRSNEGNGIQKESKKVFVILLLHVNICIKNENFNFWGVCVFLAGS